MSISNAEDALCRCSSSTTGIGMLPGKRCLDFLERVALLETPSGFALFHVSDRVFEEHGPEDVWSWFTSCSSADGVTFLMDFIKVDDKSVVRRNDIGPGNDLTFFIKKYCKNGKELIVQDEQLKHVIESNLDVKCCYKKYVVDQLMWGLKNVLHSFVTEESDSITPQYLRPLCEGLKDSICSFGINIPTEAIDRPFIAKAGCLHRSAAMLKRVGRILREDCDTVVPGIGHIIKDDLLYAEVMVKILTPRLSPKWEFSEKFEEEVAQKLEAADAAAEDARKQMDYRWRRFIRCSHAELKRLIPLKEKMLVIVKSLADAYSRGPIVQAAKVTSHSRGKRRSYMGVVVRAEGTCQDEGAEELVQAAEGTSQDEDFVDTSREGLMIA